MGITDAQTQQHAVMAALVEPLSAGQEQLADPIERVGLAPPMAERVVLHPAADLVDAAVGDANDVKRIGYTAGVIEVWRQPRSSGPIWPP